MQALAIRQSICGTLGFLASLAGGRILEAVQRNGNMVFGIPMYGQQLLSGLSCFVICAAVIYTKLVIEKQERMVQ